MAVNPGPAVCAEPWDMVVIDDDKWASADLWFHVFNGDGWRDLDQLINASNEILLSMADIGAVGEYHIVAALYVEGGGVFQPKSGVDFMAGSPRLNFGAGPVFVDLRLIPAP